MPPMNDVAGARRPFMNRSLQFRPIFCQIDQVLLPVVKVNIDPVIKQQENQQSAPGHDKRYTGRQRRPGNGPDLISRNLLIPLIIADIIPHILGLLH